MHPQSPIDIHGCLLSGTALVPAVIGFKTNKNFTPGPTARGWQEALFFSPADLVPIIRPGLKGRAFNPGLLAPI